MTNSPLLIGFQGWINTVLSSVWTYIVLAVFFALLLLLMVVHFVRSKRSKTRVSEPAVLTSGNGNKACEEKLIHSIETLVGNSKTVLMAAAGLECLPVTVPIRIAMVSSEKNRRCLLIDLDTRRNAVWKAFGLDSRPTPAFSFPAPSGIKNLAVLPAHYFEQNKQMNIKSITQHAQQQYDLILINAPFLDGHPDRKMIAASSQYAFVFAKEPSQADRLQKLCKDVRCKVLGCYKLQKNGSSGPAPKPEEASQPPHP